MALPESEAEALLIALLGGERHPDEAQVRDVFRADPALQQRYLRMRDLAAELDEHGEVDRQILAAASTPSPSDAVAREAVRRHQRPRRRTFWWPALLAAAGVLVATWFGFGRHQPQAGEDHTFGNEQPVLEQHWPADQPTGYGQFQWHLPLQPGHSYVLRFRNAKADPDGSYAIADLTAAAWRPSADDLGKLQEATEWEIEVVDAGGRQVGGAGPLRIQRR